jgi:hypothetical protein
MKSGISSSLPYIITELDGQSFLIYWYDSPKSPLSIVYQAGKEKEKEIVHLPDGLRWAHIECGPGPVRVQVEGEDPVHGKLACGTVTLKITAAKGIMIMPGSLFVGEAPNGETGYRPKLVQPLEIKEGESAMVEATAEIPSLEAILHRAGTFVGGNEHCRFENAGASIGHITIFEDSKQPLVLTQRQGALSTGFVAANLNLES